MGYTGGLRGDLKNQTGPGTLGKGDTLSSLKGTAGDCRLCQCCAVVSGQAAVGILVTISAEQPNPGYSMD